MPLSTNSGACNGGIAHSPSRFAAIATSDLAISSSLAIPISPSSPIAYQYLPPVDLQGNGSTPIDLPSTSSSSSRSKDSLPKSASGSDLLSTPPSLIPGMSPMSKEWSLYVNDDPERCSPAAPQTTMVGSYVMIPQPVYFATSQPSVNSEVYTKALSPSSSGLPYLMDQVTLAQQSGDYFVASTSTIPVHSTFVGGLPSPPTPFVDLSKSMEDVSISPAVPTYQVPRKPVFVSQAIHIDSNGNPLPHCFQLENGCSSGMYPQTEVLSLAASPLEVYEPIPVARHSYVSVPFQSPVYAYPSHVQGTLVSNCCVSPSFTALPAQSFDGGPSSGSCCTPQALPHHHPNMFGRRVSTAGTNSIPSWIGISGSSFVSIAGSDQEVCSERDDCDDLSANDVTRTNSPVGFDEQKSRFSQPASVDSTTAVGMPRVTPMSAAEKKRKHRAAKAAKLTVESTEVKKPRTIHPANYKCPYDGCTKVFTRPYNLKSHIKIHTGEKLYCCEYCPSKFTRGHDLRRHVRLHTNERPFACSRCSKSFSRSDALKRHLKVDACSDEENETIAGFNEIDFDGNTTSEAEDEPLSMHGDFAREGEDWTVTGGATGTSFSYVVVDNARRIEDIDLAVVGGF